jgi:ADP-heptose:LPS heptosyltransferase
MEDVNSLFVALSTKYFREGTKSRTRAVNFLIVQGGMGDFIGYMAAIKYIAENHPQILGRVYCFKWFMPIAENILAPYSEWKVLDHASITKKHMTTRPTFAPSQYPIDRFGSSAVDLGFIYYLGMNPPPVEGNFYPRLNLQAIEGLKSPIKNYAVMTPVTSTKPRTLPAKTFNGIKAHLIEKGVTPVFIGNTSFSENRKVWVGEGYDLEGGIDLLGKTSLLQAAGIMSKARMVIGLDNGLLHLAATTDVPIIFGYTVSSIEHTMPRRQGGALLRNIFCDPRTLPCMFCQSRMRLFGNHDFKDCLYQDELCVKAISDEKDWCKLVDEILETTSEKELSLG